MSLSHPFIIFVVILATIKVALSVPTLLRTDATGSDTVKASASSTLQILRPRYLLLAAILTFLVSAILDSPPL